MERLRLQPLAQRAQHLLARGKLVVQYVLEPLAGPVQAKLAVADQAAGIGHPSPQLVELAALALELAADGAAEAGLALRELGRQLVLDARDQLRGRGRSGGAHVGAV